eukprot:9280-Heterococcus_DN1.PRE.3
MHRFWLFAPAFTCARKSKLQRRLVGAQHVSDSTGARTCCYAMLWYACTSLSLKARAMLLHRAAERNCALIKNFSQTNFSHLKCYVLPYGISVYLYTRDCAADVLSALNRER